MQIQFLPKVHRRYFLSISPLKGLALATAFVNFSSYLLMQLEKNLASSGVKVFKDNLVPKVATG